MSSKLILAFAVIGVATLLFFWVERPTAIPSQPIGPVYAAVAPGLVEPAKEEREIGSEIIGTLRDVLVDENDIVKADQIIAVVKNDDQKASLAQAKAQLAAARANLAEIDRTYRREAILEKTHSVSTAAVEKSRDRLAVAEAEVARTNALVQQAEASLDKTLIRSPIDGTVLKKMVVAGAAISNQPPTPIAIVGDLSRLCVRADVDELDLGNVRQGQKVEIKVDAYPDLRTEGTVIRISRRLGVRRVQTDRSNERSDGKVLQVLIALDEKVSIPIGLRVDVFFLPEKM